MDIEYTVTKDDLVQARLDHAIRLGRTFSRFGRPPYLLGLSIVLALAYVQFAPATVSTGNQPPEPSFLLKYFLQFPLCVTILYLFLFVLKILTKKRSVGKLRRAVEKSVSDDDIGKRTIERREDQVVFVGRGFRHSYECGYITAVKEGDSSYAILHNNTPLVIVPKSACSLEALKEMISPGGGTMSSVQ